MAVAGAVRRSGRPRRGSPESRPRQQAPLLSGRPWGRRAPLQACGLGFERFPPTLRTQEIRLARDRIGASPRLLVAPLLPNSLLHHEERGLRPHHRRRIAAAQRFGVPRGGSRRGGLSRCPRRSHARFGCRSPRRRYSPDHAPICAYSQYARHPHGCTSIGSTSLPPGGCPPTGEHPPKRGQRISRLSVEVEELRTGGRRARRRAEVIHSGRGGRPIPHSAIPVQLMPARSGGATVQGPHPTTLEVVDQHRNISGRSVDLQRHGRTGAARIHQTYQAQGALSGVLDALLLHLGETAEVPSCSTNRTS